MTHDAGGVVRVEGLEEESEAIIRAKDESCRLCDRDPVLGASSVELKSGHRHFFCHPIRPEERDGGNYSCFELIVHAARGKIPPRPFDPHLFYKALKWARIADSL